MNSLDLTNVLLWPYVFNVVILIPIGLSTLLGGAAGGRFASQGAFGESEGFRTLVGSLWTAILIGSMMGIFWPANMSPLLLIQVIYKTLWLLVYALPRWICGRNEQIPWGITLTFAVIIAIYPWVIPWQQLFGTPSSL